MTSREPTAKDRRLKTFALAALVASQVTNILGLHTESREIVVGLALPLFAVAVVLGSWRLWRWYDQQPDGRRGE